MPECDTRIRPAAPAPALVDATATFDQFIIAALAAAQSAPNGESRADAVYAQLGAPVTLNPASHDFNKTPIERFGDGLPPNLVFKPEKAKTKYAGVQYGVWPNNEEPHPRVLSPTLMIGDIAIGLDKLGHFAQQGYAYYRMVHRAGRRLDEAEQWGLNTELAASMQSDPPYIAAYGMMSTGVFSRADLEANKAGFHFYTWVEQNASTAFSLANYVTLDWNEEHRTSYYHQDIWQTVWSNLITGTWNATVTRPGGQTSNVTFELAATGYEVTGRYTYVDDFTGQHAGRVRGALIPMIRYMNGPVGGVHVALSWTRGNATGRAYLSSEGTEHTLRGTWGFGEDRRNGGRMDLTRQ